MSHAFREPNKVELAEDTPDKINILQSDADSADATKAPENGDLEIFSEDREAEKKKNIEADKRETERIQNVLGTIIGGKYKVIEIIGSGGMSEVFKAIDVSTKRTVALKLLRPKYMTNPESVSRFQLEAKAASRLDHKNIVHVYEFGMTEQGQHYLAMEHVSGKSLSNLVKDSGRLAIARTWQILLQTCDALTQAHDKGVIHRDLKPSNIMILDDGTIKIVDFGIAKVLSKDDTAPIALTQTGDIFGSPPYMSPEQGLGREIDTRSDLYSLGCVMYECLTGSPPFIGETALETLIKHQTEAPISLEAACFGTDFPPEIEKIVAKLLEKLPKRRYQTAGDLKIDLLDYEQGNLDIGRFLKEPVEEQLQAGRQDLSDFFDRVHRHTRHSLDHLEEAPLAPPKSSAVEKLTYASFIGLCLCGVIVMFCLVSELTHMSFPGRNFVESLTPTASAPDPLNSRSLNEKDDLSDERKAHVQQLLKSGDFELVLGRWSFTPEQWKQLTTIKDVRYLDAQDSFVTNQWIEEAIQRWQLISLDLSNCKNINEFSLSKLRSNPYLQRLSLSGTDMHNYTHDSIPPNIEVLDLSKTPIDDRELKAMVRSGRLRHLKSLSLVDSHVTDQGLEYLADLPALRNLALSKYCISPRGTSALAKIKSLELLAVSGRASGLTPLSSVKQLRQLNVYTDYPISYLKDLQLLSPNLLISISSQRKNEQEPWFWSFE